jgi:hypothetical protein
MILEFDSGNVEFEGFCSCFLLSPNNQFKFAKTGIEGILLQKNFQMYSKIC